MTLPTIRVRNARNDVDAATAMTVALEFMKVWADRKQDVPVVYSSKQEVPMWVAYWTKARSVSVYVQYPREQ